MLRLTKKADYGLMALKYLAEQAEAGGSAQQTQSASASAKDYRGGVSHSAAAAGQDSADADPRRHPRLARRDQRRLLAGPSGFGDHCVRGHPRHRRPAVHHQLHHHSRHLRPARHCTIKEPLRKVNDTHQGHAERTSASPTWSSPPTTLYRRHRLPAALSPSRYRASRD